MVTENASKKINEISMNQSPKTCRLAVERALSGIQRTGTSQAINHLVELVDSSMTGRARHYHTLPHALAVAGFSDPMDILIGLCHDIVQTEIDEGLPSIIQLSLEGLITRDATGLYRLVDDARTRSDRSFEMVRIGFGFQRAQVLSAQTGKNEFLSALSAVKTLEHCVRPAVLASLTIGIEATIPFRPDTDDVAHRSLRILQELNTTFDLGLSNAQAKEEVRRSIRIANRDVASFCGEDLNEFLEDTWNLLREASSELRDLQPIDVRKYRESLQKMTRSLSGLRAEVVFRRFENEPEPDLFQKMLEKTAENLKTVSVVMKTKLLAASLLEVTHGAHGGRMKTFPPRSRDDYRTYGAADSAMSILATGKDSAFEFDIARSNLAYRLAVELSETEILQLVEKIDPKSAVEPRLLREVPSSIAECAMTLAASPMVGEND
jgi:hypothetical protein